MAVLAAIGLSALSTVEWAGSKTASLRDLAPEVVGASFSGRLRCEGVNEAGLATTVLSRAMPRTDLRPAGGCG
jgi:hypothetical protein